MILNERLPKKNKDIDENSASNDKLINNITFFGDSAIPEDDPIYKSVWNAAKLLSENKYTIVNGGGPGIMKAATDGAESVDGNTVAVYWQPRLASFFEGKNLANVTDESSANENYVNRTFGLIEKGDAYVVCKGGTGTISEFGLVWALGKLYYGCHKPVILYGDFWDGLIESFQEAMNIDEKELGVLYNASQPEEILDILEEHEKKIQHCKRKNYDDHGTGEAAFLLTPREIATRDEHDRVAHSYHSMRAGKLASQEQLDEFISLVNPPAMVLDVGCGPGFDAKYLSEKYTVSAIDISKRMTEIAQYENPDIDIKCADIVNADIGKNKYKGIWARGSLHHIPEEKLDNVFKKLYDALVDNGILYTIVREGSGEDMVDDNEGYGDIKRFYHFFSESELIKRGEDAGFKLIRTDHKKRSHKWLIGVFEK
jgi:hypothetical protein